MKDLLCLLARLTLGGVVVLALGSCGGGGDSSNDATSTVQRSGTVGILLTDMPADPAMFASINASIESVQLLGADDSGRITIFSGPTRVFDLLRLRNEAVPISYKDGIPAGKYCKIRLTLSDLQLVLADDTPTDPDDNPTFHPHLPGNGKLDLVVKDCFEIGGGEVLTIQVDIDAGNSIHIVANGKGYNFRPVIFAEVLRRDFKARLVRLEGEIARVDPLQKRLLLCEALPTHHMDSKGCAEVNLGDDSAFFDNQIQGGTPRPLDELLSDDKLGERVTVVGWPRYRVAPYADIDVPEGHYPPPGECRLWQIGAEPGLQAPAVDCTDLPEELPANTVVVTHEGPRKNLYHPLMAIDALVVELGDFLRVEGEVATDADPAGFEMTVTRGGPIIADPALGVMLQPGWPGVNGTRIVSKKGVLLAPADIVVPLPVQVDGVLELIAGSDPLLKAALVIVDSVEPGAEQVTGEVLSLGADFLVLDPDADQVCGIATGMLVVNLDAGLEILTVTITDSGSHIQPGGTLAAGQEVGMNGACGAGGYATDNVVIVEDLRP
jgi:hypothetical protein